MSSVKRKANTQESSPSSTLDHATLTLDQQYALRQVSLGRNVAITGSGGTGKSFLIKTMLREYPVAGTHVTSSTGVTAIALEGVTIHSCLGIGIGDQSVDDYVAKVRKNFKLSTRWKYMRRIIIDEMSMISGSMFDKMEAMARILKGSSRPFGGIQLIACFDALQLPPVSDPNDFFFGAQSWFRCFPWTQHVELTRVMRQSDSTFIELLQRVRFGEPTPEDIALLNSRVCAPERHVVDGVEIDILNMYPLKRNVEQMNVERLQSLPGELHTYVCHDTSRGREADEYLQSLQKNCPAPARLHLKKGALVMLLRNMSFEKKLVNGSVGVVVDFELLHDVPAMYKQRCTGDPEFREYLMRQAWPVVVFQEGVRETVLPCSWDVKANQVVMATRTQCPLMLCYAITIHKTQGMTLAQSLIHLQNVFESGQFYVAISRIQSLEGIFLDHPVDASMIIAHPRALQFYREMQAQRQERPVLNQPKSMCELDTNEIADVRCCEKDTTCSDSDSGTKRLKTG